MKKIVFPLLTAAALWFVMFSPWTAPHVNFWWTMAASGIILTALALSLEERHEHFSPNLAWQVVAGVGLAIVLWGVFWLGDKVSQWMFDFARPGVDRIYDMKGDTPAWLIGILLLLVIGPAEELFWRGFIQRRLAGRYGAFAGFVIATVCYTAVHIWSFNFMLIVAAAACGVCWGFLYYLRPRMLPALIVSHALWDVAAFVVFPF